MSRIGKKPLVIPASVTVQIQEQTVTMKGPNGELKTVIHPDASVVSETQENEKCLVVHVKDTGEKATGALWGTTRALLANMLEGVTKGFTRSLEIVGVGYRVSASGKKLTFQLGFSHDVVFEVPEGVKATIDKNTITLTSADRQLLGEVASQIRSLKKPEPYLGKGIKYTDEVLRRKAGKAATKAAA